MTALINDCFAFDDKHRMRHATVLTTLEGRLSAIVADETIPLTKAHGRILAMDVKATRDTPASDNAAVDGYAFRHADYLTVSGTLKCYGKVKAGDSAPLAQSTETACVRIFTGAPMPDGFDTVAMQEDCGVDGSIITIPAGLKHGANRRKAGEDVCEGTIIAQANRVVRAADIAAIAAAGVSKVQVRKKLRIGILSTGDEIIQPGQTAAPHQVYDANRPMLQALFDRPYAEIIDLGHIGDAEALLSQTITNAARTCDLIITSGGASRGDEDHLFDTLQVLGKAHVWQIAIKPGRPMMLGQIGNTILMALPGNPVAAMVCSLLYGRPVIAHLCGVKWVEPVGYCAPSAFTIVGKKPDRREFLRSWRIIDPETGNISIEKFSRDGSGLISGLQAAEGLAVLDETTTHLPQGTPVRFIPFSDMEL